jgi:hypothetical protein
MGVGSTCPVWHVAKLSVFPASRTLSVMVAGCQKDRIPDEKNVIFHYGTVALRRAMGT